MLAIAVAVGMLFFSYESGAEEAVMEKVAFERLVSKLELGESPERAVSAARDILHVVVPGGSAAEIPTAECLSRHLPHGRRPTRAEINAAMAACNAERQKRGH
jgi:hypothetical protein